MMLSIKNIDDVALSDILSLSVHEYQLPFIGTTESLIAKRTKGNYFHVLVLDDEVVGLFIVETECEKNYDFLLKTEFTSCNFFLSTRDSKDKVWVKIVLLSCLYLEENFLPMIASY